MSQDSAGNSPTDTIISKLLLNYQNTPQKPAYRLLSKDKELNVITYEELIARVFHLAYQIQQKANPRDRIILCAQPGIDFIVGFFACLATGTIAVPLVPPFNKMMANRFLHIIENVQPQLILFDALTSRGLNIAQKVNRFIPNRLKSYVGLSDTHQRLFKTLGTMEINMLIIAHDLKIDRTQFNPYPVIGDDVAFIQYTSGSTAEPKGVLVSHGNLVDNSEIIKYACQTTEDIICYSWLPPYHDMGLIAGIIQPVYVGGTSVLLPTLDFIAKPSRWMEGISKYRCTLTGGPNFAYELCASKATEEQIATLDLSCLQVAANGAEPINPKTMELFYTTFAAAGLRKNVLLPCYGLAESTVMTASKFALSEEVRLSVNSEQLKQNRVDINPSDGPSTCLESSGTPLMPLKIVNPELLTECGELEIGEIWIQGKSVAKGYYNNPEETAKTFHAHLDNDPSNENYLRSGDLGFLYQGQLFVCGRIKDMIIIRGQNYYPQDIELSVFLADPAIRKGCVIAYADQVEDEEILVVVAELKPKTSPQTYPEIIEHINQRLSQDSHITANAIHLVPAKSIPKTSSGKLQRRRCKQLIQEHHLLPLYRFIASEVQDRPKVDEDEVNAVKNPSQWFEGFKQLTKDEQRLAIKDMVLTSVAHYIHIEDTPIDLSKGFFDLGLDSINAVELINLLQTKLGDALILESSLLFNFPNIQAVIDYMYEELSPEKEKPLRSPPEHIKNLRSPLHEEIAVIGMSCQFPGAKDIDEFWQLLAEGKDGVREIPKERWFSEYYSNRSPEALNSLPPLKGGCIDGITEFDAGFFSISPREALLLDPQQRLLLTNAWRALENAACDPRQLRGSSTGVFIGISSHDYEHIIFSHKALIIHPHVTTGNAASSASGRLSYVLGLQGPSMAIDTACSSSLVALHQACLSLRNEECGLAIVGGVNALLSLDLTLNLRKAGMLSPDGACKTFDASANGYVRGEGCGVVILKPLSAAQRDNDRILAVIKASGINQDGASSGLTVPNGAAQKSLLQTVLIKSGLKSNDIDYIECHGTGTSLGDPIEIGAIGQVYGEHRELNHPLYLGAVKTNIGHLEAAAGIAGLIKTILALQHEQIPANLHFKTLNPHIRLNFPAEVMAVKKPWVRGQNPRRAAVSSFGFNGTNAHVIIEESAQDSKKEPVELPATSLFVLSAKTENSLQSLIGAYKDYLKTTKDSLADICYTVATGRCHFEWRIAIYAHSKEELIEKLGQTIAIESTLTEEIVSDGDLQSAYLNGKQVDWAANYAPYIHGLSKVSLPTYCFEKNHYWLT
ncbi:beta-ketoacyl synthase N-terminal-like domain-containing protein [Legionella sp. 227]|uniref:beta-ketoacyl synthase N-terminal-like domain-containing protein n=1 Tax=Legionella sp. 227 TaxID=3367288 RepID=UPI00370D84AD